MPLELFISNDLYDWYACHNLIIYEFKNFCNLQGMKITDILKLIPFSIMNVSFSNIYASVSSEIMLSIL